jgi:hypothetical protein
VTLPYVYLSGPMTGLPEWNYPTFHRVAAQLRQQGYGVHNPAEAFNGQTDLPYSQYMREDVDKIGLSDGIVLLPGWRASRGSRFDARRANVWAVVGGDRRIRRDRRAGAARGHHDRDGRLMSAEQQAKQMNPKDRVGTTKVPLSLVPSTALTVQVLAHADGALKYGAWNWRYAGVRASIYSDAAVRHIFAWLHGEEVDPDSGVHHLSHAIACLNILVDAQAVGKLVDDRPPLHAAGPQMVRDGAKLIAALQQRHADKQPHQYTIHDTPECFP